jgi:hypothetical protein
VKLWPMEPYEEQWRLDVHHSVRGAPVIVAGSVGGVGGGGTPGVVAAAATAVVAGVNVAAPDENPAGVQIRKTYHPQSGSNSNNNNNNRRNDKRKDHGEQKSRGGYRSSRQHGGKPSGPQQPVDK